MRQGYKKNACTSRIQLKLHLVRIYDLHERIHKRVCICVRRCCTHIVRVQSYLNIHTCICPLAYMHARTHVHINSTTTHILPQQNCIFWMHFVHSFARSLTHSLVLPLTRSLAHPSSLKPLQHQYIIPINIYTATVYPKCILHQMHFELHH